MDDAQTRIVMTMLTDVWSAAYILGEPTLARLISATLGAPVARARAGRGIGLWLRDACDHGSARCAGDFAAAFEWGTLAQRVNERFDDLRGRAKIYQQFPCPRGAVTRPYENCIADAREACRRRPRERADFLYAAYAAGGPRPGPRWPRRRDLDRFVRDSSPQRGAGSRS
jgi:hypothetical protein